MVSRSPAEQQMQRLEIVGCPWWHHGLTTIALCHTGSTRSRLLCGAYLYAILPASSGERAEGANVATLSRSRVLEKRRGAEGMSCPCGIGVERIAVTQSQTLGSNVMDVTGAM